MIEQNRPRRLWARRTWQAALVLLLAAWIAFETVPQVRASAIYLLNDRLSAVTAGTALRAGSDRILVTGAENEEPDVMLPANQKVTIRRGDSEQYATSRSDETVNRLLAREGVIVGLLELVRLEEQKDGILLEIASDFTYYETVTEAGSFTTAYETDYTLPKGETRTTQTGQNGTRQVTYEVVYADGAFVSRQAVAEKTDSTVSEIVRVGTLVTEAQPGDTIDTVIRSDDGSGYLIMKSGDSLHFTGSMDVQCTAYTTGEPGVGTITYTGTTVHVGVVAVDKSVIPLGTTMFITTAKGDITYGMGHAEDTGVHGKVVDLYMNSLAECNEFGRRNSVVYFLDQ